MKSVTITGVVCFLLTFIASVILLSEWYYKEDNLGPNIAKSVSIAIIGLYCYFFYKFYNAVFDPEKKKVREPSIQFFAVFCFVIQSLFSVEILGLLMIIF